MQFGTFSGTQEQISTSKSALKRLSMISHACCPALSCPFTKLNILLKAVTRVHSLPQPSHHPLANTTKTISPGQPPCHWLPCQQRHNIMTGSRDYDTKTCPQCNLKAVLKVCNRQPLASCSQALWVLGGSGQLICHLQLHAKVCTAVGERQGRFSSIA